MLLFVNTSFLLKCMITFKKEKNNIKRRSEIMDNKPNRNIIYNNEKHRVNNDYVKDIEDKKEVINDKDYHVEVAEDFTIPELPSDIIDNNLATGYTAGIITHDLVERGERIMEKNKGDLKK